MSNGLIAVAVVGLVVTFVIVAARPSTGKGSGMAARSHSFDGSRVTVAGIPLQCHHCEGVAFSRRLAKLNTTGMTMLGLDWANKDATCFVCERCGFVHWFVL